MFKDSGMNSGVSNGRDYADSDGYDDDADYEPDDAAAPPPPPPPKPHGKVLGKRKGILQNS
jgi:hypothetical protein